MILQSGDAIPEGAAYLPSTPDHVLWGRLPCAADDPVVSIDTGRELLIDTISHEGILEDQGRDPRAYFGAYGVEGVLEDAIALAASDHPRTFGVDGPHVTTGPIEVRGARVGDLLAIRVLETTPRVPYGIISNRHGRGALPGEYPLEGKVFSVFASVDERDGRSVGRLPLVPGGETTVAFDLHPFLGIMGVAVAGDVRSHTVPPGPHGGNIDINLLTVGSTLYLPVQADGALAYVGDPHFAQGDGEVSYFSGPMLNFGDFSRYGKSFDSVKKGIFWGLPVNFVIFSLLVVLTASATVPDFGELLTDPVHTVEASDTYTAVLLGGLTFVIATVGINIVANFISPAFDFSNVSPQRISWRMGGMIAALGSVLLTPWHLQRVRAPTGQAHRGFLARNSPRVRRRPIYTH